MKTMNDANSVRAGITLGGPRLKKNKRICELANRTLEIQPTQEVANDGFFGKADTTPYQCFCGIKHVNTTGRAHRGHDPSPF